MSIPNLDPQYWNDKYLCNQTGWDIGYPSPSFIDYFENIDKNSRILIPGCGNSYEGEALHKMGFQNITLLDFAATSKNNFMNRVPSFESNNFVVGDFFKINEQFDYVLEQTFFCAINPMLREKYLEKMKSLLSDSGQLVGLLFDAPLNDTHPPFGGSKNTYENLFKKYFNQVKMESCNNSIAPRQGKELWIEVSAPK